MIIPNAYIVEHFCVIYFIIVCSFIFLVLFTVVIMLSTVAIVIIPGVNIALYIIVVIAAYE